MIRCYLEGVGVAAPGLESWQALQEIVSGTRAYEPCPLGKYTPQSLPPNERRRASQLVRLAFRSIEQLKAQLPLQGYASVFCSSGGDYDIFHKICAALAQPDKIVSPTQFHNSVHNAPAGYWSIATQNTLASTTISAFDYSFVMGLMDAVCQLQQESQHLLLSTYDMVPPEPIAASREVIADYSASLLLTAHRSPNAICGLSLETLDHTDPTDSLDNNGLEVLRAGNAAARSLGLLCAIVQKRSSVVLALEGGSGLRITMEYY